MNPLLEAFLAAVQEQSARHQFPLDTETFAETVLMCQEKDEFDAIKAELESISVFDTPTGFSCPEFDEFIASAQAIGMLSRSNPTYVRASVTMSPKIGREVRSAYKDQWNLIQSIATEYLNRSGFVAAN